MMKILVFALFVPCILQLSICSPPDQPQISRGMEVAESRGLLSSIRNFFGFGPPRRTNAQKRKIPPRPQRFRQPPPPPNFPGPRPQPFYLHQGHVEVPPVEQPQDNLIRINVRHEGFSEPQEEIYGAQDSNYNIVSVNNVEFDPSEFEPPRAEDIIYSNEEQKHFQPVVPEFKQQIISHQQIISDQQIIRDQHSNEKESVHSDFGGSVSWPEDREIHNNQNHFNQNDIQIQNNQNYINQNEGFSFPKPEDTVGTHMLQNSEENDGISDFFATNDDHPNIVNSHDFKDFDISPIHHESNSVRNSEHSSSLASGPTDFFDSVFNNYFSSSHGFQRDTSQSTTRKPHIFTSTIHPRPFTLYTLPTTTRRPHSFTSNTYSPPIYYQSTTPSTTQSTPPSTTRYTTPSTTSSTRSSTTPYKPPSTTPSTTLPTNPPIYSHLSWNLPNADPQTTKSKSNETDFIAEVDKFNNNNTFNFYKSTTEQIWHRPRKTTPTPKVQQKEFTVSKGELLKSTHGITINKGALLKSTIQYDSTTPTITTYKPRKNTPSIYKAKRPQSFRVSSRYTERPTTISTTEVTTKAPLTSDFALYRTPQLTRRRTTTTHRPKTTTTYRPRITTTYRPRTTTITTHRPKITTTHRPKRNPVPSIRPQQELYNPQQYTIDDTNYKTYYSDENPPIVNFNEDFNKPFESFLPFRNGDKFFDTIFGAENPFDKESSHHSTPFAPIKPEISFNGLRGPSVLKGVTTYTKASDTAELPTQQPQVLRLPGPQIQLRDRESQRITTAKPRTTQNIRQSTISSSYSTQFTQLLKKSSSVSQENESQYPAIEGREQIDDEFSSNRFSNYPTKTPTRTVSADPQIVPVSKPEITSWYRPSSFQKFQMGASPTPLPSVRSTTKKYVLPEREESPQPSLPPLQFNRQTTHQSSFTEYKPPTKTDPEPKIMTKSQTTPQYFSQSVSVTISPPQGVIIDNQFSKEPTFHLGGVYHDWEKSSPAPIDMKNNSISVTTKAVSFSTFSMHNPLTSTYSTSKIPPRSTTSRPSTTTTWVPSQTDTTRSEIYFQDESKQDYVDSFQEVYGDEIVLSDDTQRSTTHYVQDTTNPPIIYEKVEQIDVQEDVRVPLDRGYAWGRIKGSDVQKDVQVPLNRGDAWGSKSNANSLQDTEGEVPVYLVQGSSRPPNNVWTPPTPPPASTTSRSTYRRRRPTIRRRPTNAAVAPNGGLAAVPRGTSVDSDFGSNRRTQQSAKGSDGLGWNGFPVPLMDLSISSDMQEMMAQLDQDSGHSGGTPHGSFPSSMDFMKLPSRGDQKSLNIPSIGEIPLEIDERNVEVNFPPIPPSLKGVFDDNHPEENQADAKKVNKDSYEQSSTDVISSINQHTCVHGFCEESLKADDK